MSYTKLTDFAAKDALLSGNPVKLLRGTEIGAEFDAIESAMAAAEAVNITAPIIAASTSKTTPVDADVLPILDSAAANILKKVTWVNIKATLKTYFDTLYIIAPIIAASTSKTTPVDADVLPILDSAASNILKKVTWANVKATLKTYFDTLYAATGSFAASGANSDITSLNSPAIGSATATTQSAGDNSTKVATTAFVRSVGPSYGSIAGFSTNTTLTSANYGKFIYVNGTFTLTLPVADAANIGRTITCYGYAAASVTVATQSSQLLYYQGMNTATSAIMIGVGDTVTFVNYNGLGWMAMGANALGTGQTWQSPGRSGGVTYYNTTGKPIFISVTSGSTGSGAGVNITVHGVVAAQVSGGALNRAIASAIVPTGKSYKADMLLGSALDAFTELS